MGSGLAIFPLIMMAIKKAPAPRASAYLSFLFIEYQVGRGKPAKFALTTFPLK
jgi:hypothetical protein